MALSYGDLTTVISASDFKGLYQGGDGLNAGLAYAAEGENFDIKEGALTIKHAGENLPGELPDPIGTLAALYRRFYSGSGNETLFVAAAGSKLYARELDSSDWQEIASGLQLDIFDYVSYEVNTYYFNSSTGKRVTKEEYSADTTGTIQQVTSESSPIDVLLLSNAKDGMYCVYGDTLEVVKVTVKPEGSGEVRFGVIARHAERIWGGAIDGEPDKLMYSAPYDPFDWEQNEEIPEDGAGDIMQPSWDGDSFVALRPFGSQLLAFKRRKIWRVIGQDPSTYIFKEQYGGGTINENTVAVNNEYILMLGYNGLYVYDGTVVSSFRQSYIKKFMDGINWKAIDKATAIMNGDVYMLAVPWGENQQTNNRVIEYHVIQKTFTIRTISVRTFLSSNNVLYYTSVETPGVVSILSETTTLPFSWVSAYQDLGAVNCTKSAFELYIIHIEATHAVRTAISQANAASNQAKAEVEAALPPLTPEIESAVANMQEAATAAEQARQEAQRSDQLADETEQDMAEGLFMVNGTPAQSIVSAARANAEAARERAELNDARRAEFSEEIYQAYASFDTIDDPIAYAEERYKAKLAEQSATREAAELQATTEPAEPASGLKGMAKRDSSGGTTVSEQVMRAESTDKSTKIDKTIEAPVVTMRKLAKKMGVGEGFGARRRLRTESPVLGYYDPVNESAITTPGTNSDYGVQAHELGHHLAERLNMTGTDQMVAAIDPEYAKSYTPEELKDEAFSIFVSHYMAGDIDLTTYAFPQFIRDFELALKKAKLAKDVHAARDKIQAFAAANTASRMHAMVTKAGTQDEQQAFKEKFVGVKNKIITGTFDDTYAAKAVDEATRKAGGEAGLREAARYYNKHTLGMTETIFTGNFIDPDGTPIGASLADRLQKLKVKDSDYDKVVIYMTAKHAWDRLNHERKVDGEYIADPIRTFGDMTANASEIKEYLDQIEKSTDPSDVRAISASETILKFYNEFMELWAVGEGMITEEAWRNYRRTYPHYVPMAREGFSSFDSMKNATGSDHRIKNPLQTMFLSMEKMVYRVYRNRMAQQFDSQYQSGGLGIFARPYDMVDKGSIVSLTQQDIQEAQAKVAESGGGDLDLLDLLNRKLDNRKVSHSGTDQEVNNALHVIRKDGTEAHYVIENPELYELLTQNGNHSMAKGLQAVGRITSAVTQLQTSSNPLFALRNAVRDYQKSVNYGSWGYTYLDPLTFSRWARAFGAVLANSKKYQEYTAMGNAGWHLREQIIRTDKVDNELMGKLFKGWSGNSGKATAIAKKAGKKAFNFVTLSKVNEWIEQTSRYVEYKYGKHDKSTPEGRREAYMAAQEATLDFALSGNSKTVQAVRKFMPFMNATLQGTYQTFYMFDKSQRDRLAPRLAKTIINNMIAATVPIVLLDMFGSDEDKEQYALLPDEMKATNVIFPNPGPNDEDGRRFVRLPIAQDPLAQISYLMGLEAASRVVDGEANDMDLDLWLTAHSILTNMFPDTTIVTPIIDIGRNVNWYGGSIVPTNLENEPVPRQKKETTPKLFVKASEGLYKLGIQISPLKIQYLLEQYTGFFGQIGIPAISPDPYNERKNFGQNILETFGEKFVNGWTLDPAYSNDISSAFYDQYDTMEQIYKSVKAGDPVMLKSGIDPSQYDEIRDQAYDFYHSGGALYEAKDEVNDIWDDINTVMASDMPEDQKTILVRNYRDQIVQVMQGALQETAPFLAEYVETPLDIQKLLFGAQ